MEVGIEKEASVGEGRDNGVIGEAIWLYNKVYWFERLGTLVSLRSRLSRCMFSVGNAQWHSLDQPKPEA